MSWDLELVLALCDTDSSAIVQMPTVLQLRALSFLELLRAHGVAAKMTSLQTVALPRGAPPGTMVHNGFNSPVCEIISSCERSTDHLAAAGEVVAMRER
eukprot:10226-Heterococcus_DN1.PRE.2